MDHSWKAKLELNQLQKIKSKGKAMSERRTALVASTVRNGGALLTDRIRRLDLVLSQSFETTWLVVESDSDDNTLTDLMNISRNETKFRCTSMGHLRGQMPLRTERLAFCRNYCVTELLSNPKYKNINYLIVVDLDEVNDKLVQESLNSISFENEWGAVFANQNGPYYDIWALRHQGWCPGDCWKQYRYLKKMGVHENYAQLISVASKMMLVHIDSEWIEVESAFGGLGIYNRKFINSDCKYVGTDQDGEETCEHVTFNMAMRNNGAKLFIVPGLINAGIIPLTEQYDPLIQVLKN